MSIRIHALAKELNVTSKELIDFINRRQDKYGLEIKTPSNAIAPIYAEAITNDFSAMRESAETAANTAPEAKEPEPKAEAPKPQKVVKSAEDVERQKAAEAEAAKKAEDKAAEDSKAKPVVEEPKSVQPAKPAPEKKSPAPMVPPSVNRPAPVVPPIPSPARPKISMPSVAPAKPKPDTQKQPEVIVRMEPKRSSPAPVPPVRPAPAVPPQAARPAPAVPPVNRMPAPMVPPIAARQHIPASPNQPPSSAQAPTPADGKKKYIDHLIEENTGTKDSLALLDLAFRQRKHTENKLALATAEHDLGVFFYLMKNDLETALNYTRDALNIRKRYYGSTHPSTMSSRLNLGTFLLCGENSERTAEGIQMYRSMVSDLGKISDEECSNIRQIPRIIYSNMGLFPDRDIQREIQEAVLVYRENDIGEGVIKQLHETYGSSSCRSDVWNLIINREVSNITIANKL